MTLKIQSDALQASVQANFSASRQSGATGFQAALEKAKKPSAAQELDDYMRKSPAERMVDIILKSMGLTREDLASKSPEEQTSIMQKVNQILKQKMEEAAAKQGSGNTLL
ncbi:hypothetical protein [Duganella qianjiadongensis]|uniref:Uncharacterized protein n=1 Tax=Duganella qianjiadongensis TaxID=2692176 RepID=A0ABW9VMB7_9BURK|nr:hypothetical protein [Duganella qianjiadongensis]MYM40593.1 hypothetical protein [Duganella qianjiadongensis]